MKDRFNTIAGWALGGGIVLLGGTLVAGELLHSERPEKMGYPIQGVQEEGKGNTAQADPPVAAVLATADPAKGQTTFQGKCGSCHNATQGGANGIGPNLYHVVGEAIAADRGGFPFSDALKSHGGNWDFDNLYAWLRNPRAFASGTKMTFVGLPDPQDRANVIAYLNAQGSNVPLPAAPPPGAAAGGEGNAAAPAANGAAPAAGNAAGNASTNSTTPGAAHDQPVQNSAQVARQPRGNAGGDAAPQPGGH